MRGLYWVFGVNGSGKSTVCNRLKNLGYNAVETDREIAGWVHTESGAHILTQSKPLPPGFRDSHRWCWIREKFEEVISKEECRPVFFCGSASNAWDYSDFFDIKFGLYVDEVTLVQRLQQREPSKWKNESDLLSKVLERRKKFVDTNSRRDVVLVDASGYPSEIVENILLRCGLQGGE
ncbi:MAG: hypothetical protein JJU06_03490 [Ectothiorhodospiraceae bacterium]|nr:hypothetical protein [Ectothiorhodospiraceae bacterium]